MLLVSVYLILVFHFIVVSFFSNWVFISLYVASVAVALVFMPGLYSAVYSAAKQLPESQSWRRRFEACFMLTMSASSRNNPSS